ncbi:MAG: alpha/beta fold hydrolase, partial [Solirubrobacteraceae bacterium]
MAGHAGEWDGGMAGPDALGGHTALLLAARGPSSCGRSWSPRRRRRPIPTRPPPWRDGCGRGRSRSRGARRRWASSATRPGAGPGRTASRSARTASGRPSQRDSWDEWRRVSCPTLVVRAGDDGVPAELVERMVGEGQNARSAVVTDAGHDLHLYQPERWREVVERFLAERGLRNYWG